MTYSEAAVGTAQAIEVLILATKDDLVDVDRDTVGELDSEVGEPFLVKKVGLHSARHV